MIKAVGIIPARWGSTRFPGKPLHRIAGKPLLQHVWERCSRAKSLDAVIIATDDMRIAKAAFEWGAEVSLTSTRHKSGTDRIAEVARHASQFGIIVNIQGDEPLIDPKVIDKLVRKLRENPKINMVTAGHPFSRKRDMESPHQVKVAIDRSGRALDFSRRTKSVAAALPAAMGRPSQATRSEPDWHFPPQGTKTRQRRAATTNVRILRHQGIYAFRRRALLRFVRWKQTRREKAESLEQLRALENGVTVHVLVTKHGSPGVDTPQDAKELARKLARTKSVAKSVVAAVPAATRRQSQATRSEPDWHLPLQAAKTWHRGAVASGRRSRNLKLKS